MWESPITYKLVLNPLADKKTQAGNLESGWQILDQLHENAKKDEIGWNNKPIYIADR